MATSEQGPTQAQHSKEQRNALGSCPAAGCRAAYHFHQRGLGGNLMCVVMSRLPCNGLPSTGGLSVRCETDSDRQRKRQSNKWLGISR